MAPAASQQPVEQDLALGPRSERAATVSQRKLRNSCDACQEAKVGCSQEKPSCRRCSRSSQRCVYSPFRRIGRPPRSSNAQATGANNTGKSRSKPQNQHEDHAGDTGVAKAHGPSSHDTTSSASFAGVLSAARSPVSIDRAEDTLFPLSSEPFHDLAPQYDSALEDLDPCLSGQDFADPEPPFGDRHGLQMTTLFPQVDSTMLDPQQLVHPLSTSSNMAGFFSSGKEMDRPLGQAYPEESESGAAPMMFQSRNSYGPGCASTPGLTSGTSLTGPMCFPPNSGHGWSSGRGEDTSRHIQNIQTTASASNPFSLHSPRPSSTSSLPDCCRTNCYPSLSQQLSYLNEQLSESCKPGLDVILQVERDTRSLREKILGCKACFHNRSIFLLLTMVLEQVMRLLETITLDESDPFSADHMSNGASPPSMSQCVLVVGDYQTDDETRASFVKRHLQFRLNRFARVVVDLGKVMNEDLKDINLKAARDMLEDVFQRMELLRGVVELWE